MPGPPVLKEPWKDSEKQSEDMRRGSCGFKSYKLRIIFCLFVVFKTVSSCIALGDRLPHLQSAGTKGVSQQCQAAFPNSQPRLGDISELSLSPCTQL